MDDGGIGLLRSVFANVLQRGRGISGFSSSCTTGDMWPSLMLLGTSTSKGGAMGEEPRMWYIARDRGDAVRRRAPNFLDVRLAQVVELLLHVVVQVRSPAMQRKRFFSWTSPACLTLARDQEGLHLLVVQGKYPSFAALDAREQPREVEAKMTIFAISREAYTSTSTSGGKTMATEHPHARTKIRGLAHPTHLADDEVGDVRPILDQQRWDQPEEERCTSQPAGAAHELGESSCT